MVRLGDVVVEAFKEITEAATHGGCVPGLPFGYAALDRLTTGMHPGELIVVAARPGMGKTAFALNVAHHATKARQDAGRTHTTLLVSLECGRSQIGQRLLCAFAEIDSHRLRSGALTREQWPQVTHTAAALTDMPLVIDDRPLLTLNQIRQRARGVQGLGLIVLDYVQLIRPSARGDTRERAMTDISRGLKRLARELRVPVLVTAQLSRNPEGRNHRDHRPRLSDLHDAGALEEDADLVVFIHRDRMYKREIPSRGTAEIIIAKQRRGPTGTVRLAFQTETGRFTDVPQDDAGRATIHKPALRENRGSVA